MIKPSFQLHSEAKLSLLPPLDLKVALRLISLGAVQSLVKNNKSVLKQTHHNEIETKLYTSSTSNISHLKFEKRHIDIKYKTTTTIKMGIAKL